MAAAIPHWLRTYRRGYLVADVVAGLVIWSVVVPQAVAYAQIAGLPPQAGLLAAPGAMLAYAFLGTSRTLVVGATTSASALSASAVGPLAGGNAAHFAALAAALALATALVFALACVLRLGAIADFISKPVMTGFLFGLGLSIAAGQLAALLGLPPGEGGFFGKLGDAIGDLGQTDAATAAVSVLSIGGLVALRRFKPAVPGTLVVLVLSILASWLLDLKGHGVAVVGSLPSAFPHPALPDVGWSEFAALIPAAFGIMVLSTEGIGVARALASEGGYAIDVNRELMAFGGSNLLAGLSQGYVQLGGASQTAAAARAGGRSQLAGLVCAGLVLLTGAFLAPLFEDLPKATLAAIVVVAVAGFWRVAELRRFGRLRRSAVLLALVAIAGVLVLGVLRGLLVAAVISLILVLHRLSRPAVVRLARDPQTGVWGRLDRHPEWEAPPGAVVARVEGPLFYANAGNAKERLLALAGGEEDGLRTLVLDLGESSELDVQAVDTLDELATELARSGVELRLAGVRSDVLAILRAGGLAERARVTVDSALAAPPPPAHPESTGAPATPAA